MNIQEQVDEIELPEEFDGLPVFLVGGAVRDMFREVEPTDHDLMVAEVTPDEMMERGFTHVDNDNGTFAVFIDSLGREVSIAREETSTGDGHTDFEVTPVPADIEAGDALRRDLERRDITVNAMAIDIRHHVLHDPFGGRSDLILDRISAVNPTSFVEDPLRVLRAARFAARLDAEIEPETMELMKESAPDIENLPSERTRMELEKNFKQSQNPRKFFDVLQEADALSHTFPELDKMQEIPAGPEQFHKEGSAFEHTLRVIDEMFGLRGNDELALLMAFAHDLGKLKTPSDELPAHHCHGKRGLPVIEQMNQRLRFSNEQMRAMKEAAEHHMRLKNFEDMREATLFDTFQHVRNPMRLADLMLADALGREPRGDFPVEDLKMAFGRAKQAAELVKGQDLMEDGYNPEDDGEKFGKMLRDRRISKMKELK